MADNPSYEGTVEVPSGATDAAKPGIMDVSGQMMVLTYVTFAITAFVLYKIAWKPILNLIDKREENIRRSVEEAEKTRAEYANIDSTRSKLIEEADQRARDIVDKARIAASEAGRSIENKARQEASILLENARREIRAAQDKAMAAIRKESASMVIEVSRKVLQENLDEDRSRALADKMIQQV
jgi:F-type H+-transporting ATPase subunit b